LTAIFQVVWPLCDSVATCTQRRRDWFLRQASKSVFSLMWPWLFELYSHP